MALSHIGFQWLQSLVSSPNQQIKLDSNELETPRIIIAEHPATKTCSAPLCAACQLSRLTKRTPNIRPSSTPLSSSCINLKTNYLNPGDCISMDHYKSTVRGCLTHTKGKERETEQF